MNDRRPMPAAFFGHGSPMNALEVNRFSSAWRSFGQSVPRPRAILVVSAHWFTNFTAVTAMPRPRTIHDFFGFPQRLFDVEYPAPGDAAFAQEIRDLVKPTRVGLDQDTWGIDHGAWSVLVHAFPAADVPVVQLSIHAMRSFDSHIELGAKLSSLRDSGVLILGSGNVVHNLAQLDWGRPDHAFEWTRRFDEDARAMLVEKPSELARLVEHPDYSRSVPTTEHFIPLLYLAGLSAAAKRPVETLVDGYSMGSLSMASYTLDCRCPADEDPRSAAGIPDADLPPEEMNV